MVTLEIPDVPAELRDKLVAAAYERGQSPQAYLLDMLRDEARRPDIHRLGTVPPPAASAIDTALRRHLAL